MVKAVESVVEEFQVVVSFNELVVVLSAILDALLE